MLNGLNHLTLRLPGQKAYCVSVIHRRAVRHASGDNQLREKSVFRPEELLLRPAYDVRQAKVRSGEC